jgi:hypothetical protein
MKRRSYGAVIRAGEYLLQLACSLFLYRNTRVAGISLHHKSGL